MTLRAEPDTRPDAPSMARTEPGFKPVALPALAAAIQASRFQQSRPKVHELPPILRKQAILD